MPLDSARGSIVVSQILSCNICISSRREDTMTKNAARVSKIHALKTQCLTDIGPEHWRKRAV